MSIDPVTTKSSTNVRDILYQGFIKNEKLTKDRETGECAICLRKLKNYNNQRIFHEQVSSDGSKILHGIFCSVVCAQSYFRMSPLTDCPICRAVFHVIPTKFQDVSDTSVGFCERPRDAMVFEIMLTIERYFISQDIDADQMDYLLDQFEAQLQGLEGNDLQDILDNIEAFINQFRNRSDSESAHSVESITTARASHQVAQRVFGRDRSNAQVEVLPPPAQASPEKTRTPKKEIDKHCKEISGMLKTLEKGSYDGEFSLIFCRLLETADKLSDSAFQNAFMFAASNQQFDILKSLAIAYQQNPSLAKGVLAKNSLEKYTPEVQLFIAGNFCK